MKFRETTQEDMDYLANHSISQGVTKQQPEQIDFCYTLEHEGTPLGIGGFRLINPTTAWCWVDLSDTSGKYIRTVYRVISEWIDEFSKNHNLRRLEAYVRIDFPEAIRMVEHLGFERESVMSDFIGEESAYLYKRIF